MAHEQKKLPPEWYSALEAFIKRNRWWIAFGLYLLVFFILPIFTGPDLDDYWIDGRR